jgi:hypothetical protein
MTTLLSSRVMFPIVFLVSLLLVSLQQAAAAAAAAAPVVVAVPLSSPVCSGGSVRVEWSGVSSADKGDWLGIWVGGVYLAYRDTLYTGTNSSLTAGSGSIEVCHMHACESSLFADTF